MFNLYHIFHLNLTSCGLFHMIAGFVVLYSGVDLPWSKIKTAHIYQIRWPNVILRRIGIDFHSASNLLLLWDLVEAAFVRFYLAIIPKDDVFIVHISFFLLVFFYFIVFYF